MKHYLLIFTASIILLLSGIASAFQYQKSTWELGLELSHIEYEEPGVMKEDGLMFGPSASYTYHDNIMLRGEARYSYGKLDYQGSGTIDDIDNNLFGIRAVAGYDFTLSQSAILTPYIGFGYRYLNDDSSGMTSSTGARGYERESNYYYSPIGVEALTDLGNGWFVGGVFEYDYFWKGKQKSHLGDAIVGLSTVENDQDSGYGLRGSVKIVKETGRVTFLLEPFIRYWDIDESDISTVSYFGTAVGTGYEPDNDSTEIGLKAAIRF